MDIKNLISQMTLEEKASMCFGKNLWETKNIDRLGIPSITFADGPHGLVKRSSPISEAVPATCFPTSAALASSWDTDLIYNIGNAIGQECQAEDVQILLGPSINIQRSPLGGRNFDYYSEDPVLSGEMGAAFIKGVQSEGVGACVKHYIGNNQENHRQIINNIIDEQALHEIYLSNFKTAITKGNPFAVMAAYNKVNGIPCTENKYLLTDILRNKWNFDGFVVSDWYAVNSAIDALEAGLDLVMPSHNDINDKKIIDAVLKGDLDPAVLDNAVERILNIVFKVTENQKEYACYDKEKHNDLAREAAANSIVLLKNKRELLPLKKVNLKNKKIAIIGEYAKKPIYQGIGSSSVMPTTLDNAYDEISKLAGNSAKIRYAKGYNISGEEQDPNDSLLKEAKKTASESDIVILFVGTPEAFDTEGKDRTNINLPDNQVRLIKDIGKDKQNLIVILNNGSPVTVSPWARYANTIVEAWLTGQASGGAIADILFGIVNPSGKLPSTFPVQLADNPTYLDYADSDDNLMYKEGIFVGYRYYDKKNMKVEFPFGFGLSYASFSYRDLNLNNDVIKDNDELEVKIKVKNIGRYFGKEVVQLYVRNIISTIPKPMKELRAFKKVPLFPNEEKEISFILNKNDFSYYDVNTNEWIVESGPYEILICKSSRDDCLVKNVYVQSSFIPKINYTKDTLSKYFFNDQKVKEILEPIIKNIVQFVASNTDSKESIIDFFMNTSIGKLINLSNGIFTEEMLNNILNSINES